MRIGFYIDARIGDSIVAIPAIRAIKQVYPSCFLCIFTNEVSLNLYQALPWIDQMLLYQNPMQISHFNLNYLISSNCDKHTISTLKQSNAQKIITYLKPYNLFDFRIKSTFISYKFKPQSEKQNLLDLVGLIFPRPKLKLSDIQDYKLQTLPKHKEHIDSFLTPLVKNQKPIVMINPFGFAAKNNLTLQEYEQIAFGLVQQYNIILPTFENRSTLIYKTFSQELIDHPNFFIFENNSDLLNLVELIARMDLVISPSTGNIHIADNLGISSIGLFSHKDTIKWGGDQMHYVLLDQISSHQAITDTIKMAHTLLQSH